MYEMMDTLLQASHLQAQASFTHAYGCTCYQHGGIAVKKTHQIVTPGMGWFTASMHSMMLCSSLFPPYTNSPMYEGELRDGADVEDASVITLPSLQTISSGE